MPSKRGPASPCPSGGTSDGGGGGGDNADGLPHLPKLPMVRHGKQWFRCKTLRTTSAKVQLEYCGFEGDKPPFWLPLTSDRLWRGSYKGKDWRHLGDGAWEPRDPACKSPSQKGSGLKAGSDGDSEDGDLPDEEPAPETPAVKRAASATATRDVKPLVSGSKPVKAEVAASSKGPAAGKPAAGARSSAGDGAAAVSSRAPAAAKALQPEASERTRAGFKPKTEPPTEGKGGVRTAREANKPSSDPSRAAAGKASTSSSARGRAAAAEKVVPAPASRAPARPRKARQQEAVSPPVTGKAAKQQPAAGRTGRPAGKGAALRNGDAASAARQETGNLSRAGSAGGQSRRGAADAGRAQAVDGKLGAPPTPAINRKRKGGAAAGGGNEQAARETPPAKRQQSGSLQAKAVAPAAVKGRRKSPRGEGVPAAELQLPNKRTRVKQEPEEQLEPAAEDDLPAAGASGEATDEEEPEDVKRADSDAEPAGPLSGDAEDGPGRLSREADSSSLGSSKQPVTPQPPGGAAVAADAEGAAPAPEPRPAGPAAADDGPVAEDLPRGGAGSPASGSTRSVLGRKGSDRSAPGKRNGSRSQQVASAVAADSDGASPPPKAATIQPAAESGSPAEQPPSDLAEGTACSDVAQRRADDEGASGSGGSGASNGDASEPAARGSSAFAAQGAPPAELAARDGPGTDAKDPEADRGAPDSRAASVAPTAAPVVAARASGASRRKRSNPPPAAAPADSLPLPPALGRGEPHGGIRWDTRSSGSLAEDAELLLLAARESIGRRHHHHREADGGGSGGGSWGRRGLHHDHEHRKMSKRDRWAAIARMIELDDAEADSEDFDPDSGEPEPRRPPPGPGPSVRKGRWAKRNMMATEDSPPPERARRERSTSVHRYGEEVVEDEQPPVKRGRWAGHVKKPRANSNGTSNLKPRGSGGAPARVVANGNHAAPRPAPQQPQMSRLRTFTALFTALGAAEKGLPVRSAQGFAQARLFGSRWLQAAPHAPRIVVVRPDLFPSPAINGAAISPRIPPPVPLFR